MDRNEVTLDHRQHPGEPGLARSANGFARAGPRRLGWTRWLGWLTAAASAGAILPFLSPIAASILIAVLLVTGLGLVARRRYRRPLRSLSTSFTDGGEGLVDLVSGSSRRFRFARYFYYLGLLFIGQLVLRPAAGLTLSDLFFLVAFGATCLELISSRSALPRIRPRALVLGVMLFSIGALISSVPLASPGLSLSYAFRFVYLTVIWFWVGSVVLRNHRQVALATSFWVISIALSGLAAVGQLLLGDVIPGTSPVYGRMTGTAVHINDLGGMAGIALPAAIVLLTRPWGAFYNRWLALALILFVAAGAVLSGSVGGLLAAAVGGAVYASASRIRGRSVVTALVVLVGGVLLVNAQQDAGAPSPFERVTQVTGAEDDSGATLWSRLDTNVVALEAIARSPIVGRGLGQTTTTGFNVHNIVLGPWFEAGIFAMVGIVLIVVGVARVGLHVVRTARSRQEWQLAIGLLAAFSSFLVFAMGAPVLFQRYGWVAAAMVLALGSQQRRTGPSPVAWRQLEGHQSVVGTSISTHER
jgi:O-antigen ligase